MEKGKVSSFFKRNFLIIIFVLIVSCFFIYTFTSGKINKKVKYTVVNGTIEVSDQTTVYLAKNETVIDYDTSKPVTALVEQGKKASKNESIATYQNEDYEEYLREIENIDMQIKDLVSNLPPTYSSDLTNVEESILNLAKEAQNTTSYSKMQEYKAKMDELAYKKITILANSSPDNSGIRELLNKRDELVSLSKSSPNIIVTPESGIVTYKLDGLENKLNYSAVESFDAKQIDNLITEYSNVQNSKFGIKVVDNFGIYFLSKTEVGDNKEYIKEGRNYKIRVADLENQVITTTLVKNIEENGYNYSIFKMDNNIDDLIDFRAMSSEIIWKSITGLAVPLTAIHTSDKGYDYVEMVYGARIVEVPINIEIKSDSIAIIENFTDEDYTKYGLEMEGVVELYDELIIGE